MKGFFTKPHKEDGVVCVPCIPMGSHTVLPSCLRVPLCSAVLQAAWASGSALLLAGQGQEAAPHLHQPQRGGIPGTFSPWY